MKETEAPGQTKVSIAEKETVGGAYTVIVAVAVLLPELVLAVSVTV